MSDNALGKTQAMFKFMHSFFWDWYEYAKLSTVNYLNKALEDLFLVLYFPKFPHGPSGHKKHFFIQISPRYFS